MMELPETTTLSRQVSAALADRTVTNVLPPTHLHRFTFFNGSTAMYCGLLVGRRVISAEGHGIFVEIVMEDGVRLSVCDGINMRLDAPIPSKYQMLLTFDDHTFVSFTTSMYGGIHAFRDELDNKYRTLSFERVSPLDEAFDEAYFERLVAGEKKELSVKALLAAKQRIPGLGNGVLQDILYHARICPKHRISSLSDVEKEGLFHSMKHTLRQMTDGGGRDTETDFFGRKGRYRCLLSKNTYGQPCPRCGGVIRRETYMGGSVYYCPDCQKTDLK